MWNPTPALSPPAPLHPGRGPGLALLLTLLLLGCGPELQPLAGRDQDRDAGPARAAADAGPPPCGPLLTGEVIINEVVLRPGGLDLDGDGASTGRDEIVELISDAPDRARLVDSALYWRGQLRGRVAAGPCVEPGEAMVLAGHLSGALPLPPGAVQVTVDRTLRLTDSGGHLELRGPLGTPLAVAEVPAADGAPAVFNRQRDGDRLAPLVAHGSLPGATRPTSPGRCADGALLPACLTRTSAAR